MKFHIFTVENILVRALVKENWVEFNFYAPNEDWRRFFISTAGFNGSNEELEEVGRNLVLKHQLIKGIDIKKT